MARRADRFEKGKYRWDSVNVTDMIKEVFWIESVDSKRKLRLAIFYKIVHDLVAVPANNIFIKAADTKIRSHHSHTYKQIKALSDNLKHYFSRGLLLNGAL